ncbi:hypothetical protein N8199_04055 [Emcibacteraceae bacterium]|nr:hypothetical protein [Emcibacteraceae bacterium]MDC0082308.1 hypothetical protein [Emcibacteraceae bacterium]MDC1429051.1 hypothetical protein [Emcibacteraceae bacterium]
MTKAQKDVPDQKTSKATLQKTIRRPKRLFLVFLVFIFGAALSIYFMPVLKERLPILAWWVDKASSSNLANVNRSLLKQQAEIKTIKTKTSDIEMRLNQPAQNLPALELRIKALEKNFRSLSKATHENKVNSFEKSPLKTDPFFTKEPLGSDRDQIIESIAQIEKRIIHLERVAEKDTSVPLLNLKIAELKSILFAGLPYSAEFQTVRHLTENGSLSKAPNLLMALDHLSASASMGIRTVAQIRNDFNTLIPELLKTADLDETASWWQNTLTGIKNIITVRNIKGTSSNDNGIDNFIARIEAELKAANVTAALILVAQLPASTITPLDQWVLEAKNWLQAEGAMRTLETAAAELYLSTPLSTEQKIIS